MTFRCRHDKSKPITLFYFQKEGVDKPVFINGYHTSKTIDAPTWSNTRMDQGERTTVHMFNLNASHEGDYTCNIVYSNLSLKKTLMKVSVTGKIQKKQCFTHVV